MANEKERVVEVLKGMLPPEYQDYSNVIADRIMRIVTQPDPFKADPMMHVAVSARFECPCAARDVLTQTVMIPFDVDEDSFRWIMKNWWTELKHEVRAHILAPDNKTRPAPQA